MTFPEASPSGLTFVYLQHHLAYIASENCHVIIATDIRVNRMAGLQRGIYVIALEGEEQQLEGNVEGWNHRTFSVASV
jgi:hypothetical protein